MKQLLRFEFRKLFRAKSFIVCSLISFALILISVLTYKALSGVINDPSIIETGYTGLLMLKSSYNNGSVTLIGSIMISLLVCDDYTNDTLKNVYAKGYTKENVFLAKMISSLTAFLIMLLGGMILSFFFGCVFFDGVGEAGSNYAGSMIAIILIALAYFTIFFSIAILLRKLSLSITINIIGPIGMTAILALADSILKIKDFSLTSYWLDGRLTELSKLTPETSSVIGGVVVAIVVIAGFFSLGYFIHRKRDN